MRNRYPLCMQCAVTTTSSYWDKHVSSLLKDRVPRRAVANVKFNASNRDKSPAKQFGRRRFREGLLNMVTTVNSANRD